MAASVRSRRMRSIARRRAVVISQPAGSVGVPSRGQRSAAIELASRIPAARLGGAIEVRPIAEW